MGKSWQPDNGELKAATGPPPPLLAAHQLSWLVTQSEEEVCPGCRGNLFNNYPISPIPHPPGGGGGGGGT